MELVSVVPSRGCVSSLSPSSVQAAPAPLPCPPRSFPMPALSLLLIQQEPRALSWRNL